MRFSLKSTLFNRSKVTETLLELGPPANAGGQSMLAWVGGLTY